MYIVQVLINGILLGGIYAVIGLGMSLILGIVKLTNLAHGEYVIVGAFASTVLSEMLGIDPLLTIFISIPLMFIFGYLLQRILINHSMKRGAEPALLVTFGISIILKDAMLLKFSPDARHISTSYSNNVVNVFGMDISLLNCLLLFISIIVILLLTLFLDKTYMGKAIRATADDAATANMAAATTV